MVSDMLARINDEGHGDYEESIIRVAGATFMGMFILYCSKDIHAHLVRQFAAKAALILCVYLLGHWCTQIHMSSRQQKLCSTLC